MKRYSFIVKILVCIILFGGLLSVSIFFQPRDKPFKNKANIPDKELLEIRLKGTYQEVSAGMTPRNPFYFFDLAGEKIKLFFIKDAEKRAFFVLLLSQEKISEIKILTEKNTKYHLIKIAERYHAYYLQSLLTQLAAFTPPYPEFLNDLATRVSESMSHQISETKNNKNLQQNINTLFYQAEDVISATFAETDTIERISRENKNKPAESSE